MRRHLTTDWSFPTFRRVMTRRQITPLRTAIFEDGRAQKDIAAEAGINPGTLSRIVNGLHANENTRARIAKALRRSLDELWPPDVREAA